MFFIYIFLDVRVRRIVILSRRNLFDGRFAQRIRFVVADDNLCTDRKIVIHPLRINYLESDTSSRGRRTQVVVCGGIQ